MSVLRWVGRVAFWRIDCEWWPMPRALGMSERLGTVKHDMDLAQLEANAQQASDLLKSMSNQHRLMILCQLLDQELRVGDLEKRIGLSQSALSQHLARLRRDGLVKTRREAQTIFYSLQGGNASSVIDVLYGLYCGKSAAE